MTATVTTCKGGAWLIEDASEQGVFTREKLNDEQKMIGQSAGEFIDKDVTPATDRLESKDWTFARELVQRAGGLGLLATDVPDEYGGLDLDKVSSGVLGETGGPSGSFRTAFRP